MSKRVFVSYSDHDREVVETIVSRLEADGVSCWVAYRDVVGGKDYREAIVEAIEQSDRFLLIFSRSANDSEHVGREVLLASDWKKTVIPVRVEDIRPTGRMAYNLAGLHWLEYWKSSNRSLDELSRLLGGERKTVKPNDHQVISKPELIKQSQTQTISVQDKGGVSKGLVTSSVFALIALIVVIGIFAAQSYKSNYAEHLIKDSPSSIRNSSEQKKIEAHLKRVQVEANASTQLKNIVDDSSEGAVSTTTDNTEQQEYGNQMFMDALSSWAKDNEQKNYDNQIFESALNYSGGGAKNKVASNSTFGNTAVTATINAEKKSEAVTSVDKKYEVGEVFSDCDLCPEMVVIPAGEFLMGNSDADGYKIEKPQHKVSIQQFALGRSEITVREFRQFVEAKSYITDAEGNSGCYGWNGQGLKYSAAYSWKNAGFEQSDMHPVICISWNDAQQYVQWLNSIGEKSYRLPSEAELEYVMRKDNQHLYPWGRNAEEGCDFANLKDRSFSRKMERTYSYFDCEDGYVFTAPVKNFKPNSFSVFDISGNAWEWVEDCWHKNYDAAPKNGNAWLEGVNSDCSYRVLRGGGWGDAPSGLRSSERGKRDVNIASSTVGFRLARSL